MENISSAGSGQLLALLVQQIEDERADLVSRYFDILREVLFSSRAEVRPNTLKSLAADEVEVLLRFLRQRESPTARGERLHQTGFQVAAILKLSHVTRQFLLSHLKNDQVADVVEIVDAYEMAIVEGFVQSMENMNRAGRAELERVANALVQKHSEK